MGYFSPRQAFAVLQCRVPLRTGIVRGGGKNSMDTGPVPLTGQAWLLCGFDFAYDEDQHRPTLYAANGETPFLVVPSQITWEDLDDAFAMAIARLYLKRYGVVNLVRGIRAWDDIVADLGGALEEAGD
jgi:hypothetical protein